MALLTSAFFHPSSTTFPFESGKEQASPIRALHPLEDIPGLISLLAGLPNPEYFPFESLSFTAPSPSRDGPTTRLTIDNHELASALQYGRVAGQRKLINWASGLQEREHGRKIDAVEGLGMSIGSGSQDVICKAVQVLVNPGDPLLIEKPVFASILPIFGSLGCEFIVWRHPEQHQLSARESRPFSLRKKHDFLILEDDPYYFLYYGSEPRPPSYFSPDMFFWFKLPVDPDPSKDGNSEYLIRTTAVENGVLALPGTVFFPNGGKTAYVRAAFSLLDDEKVHETVRRLGEVVLQARVRNGVGRQ